MFCCFVLFCFVLFYFVLFFCFFVFFDTTHIFLDTSAITGQYTCSTLLCLSIYLMVVKHIELENNMCYYWAFWSSAIFIPILFFIPAMLAPTQTTIGICSLANGFVNILLKIPYVVALALQMLMVGLTLKHIKKVSVLKVNNTTNLPTKFIFVRFIAAAIAQIYNLLPAQYMLTFPEQVHLHAIFVRFAIVCSTCTA
eukprot:Phypoly_transcript_08464.p1 GENE.Phypoly_transcript_08464~~Phypoly_transcript_08464.p1  ORF type:complete len:197 (+),score=11.00 Phypoly_transcript_08464:473-1063(+)